MAKSINNVVTEKVLNDIDALVKKLVEADEALISASKSGKTFSNSISTPPSNSGQLNKELKESQRLIQQLQKEQKSYENTLNSLKSKIDALTATKKTQTAQDRQTVIDNREIRKELDGQAIANSNLTTFIQKLSVERQKAAKIVADYNAQIALGNSLTDQQQKELAESTAAFTKYDAAIKAGKQSIGDAREYVGQYERANWGLNNSINQITRELPAFTFNAQTGFLAISNNIPMLVDEINKLKATNKELIAQGQPQKSILKEVAGAFFSWNTVISLAITLTTLYGKEIGLFIKQLFTAKGAANDYLEIQKSINEAQIEGTKSAIRERIELTVALKSAKDKNKEYSQRLANVEKIQKQYPQYLGNLTKEQILLGDTAKAEEKLNQALLQRARSQAAIAKITEIESTIIDLLEKEEQQALKLNEAKKEQTRVTNLLSEQVGAESVALRKQAEDRTNLLDKQRNQTIEEIELNRKKSEALLRYATVNNVIIESEEKASDSKKQRFQAEEDYLKSLFELEKRRLEVVRDSADEIMADEERSYEDRLNAQSVFYDTVIKLAELEKTEQLRLLKFETNNQVAELKHRQSQGELSQKQYAKAINGIAFDSANKRELIELNYLESINKANIDTVEKLKGLWEELTLQRNLNAIDAQELQGIKELEKILNSIDFSNLAPTDADVKKVEDAMQRLSELLQQNADEAEMLRLQEKEANIINQINQLVFQGEYGEKKLQLENELTQNRKDQAQLRVDIAREENQKELDEFKKMVELKKRLQEELYSSLKDLANQLFENSIQKYDQEIEKSNEYYDTLIENAEQGSEQEKRLQEEKEANEERLRRKRIDTQRRQAIFNKILSIGEIAINTAVGVTRAFRDGMPQLIPLIIGTGAAQTAVVLATPLPQYKDGRKGGKAETAIVGDGGVSEIIENPHTGKIRITPAQPTVTQLAKDEIVHKSVDDFINSKPELIKASIMASFTNQSNQLKAFDYYLGRELNGLSSKIEKGIEKGFKKSKINVYNDMPKIDLEHWNYKNRGFNA